MTGLTHCATERMPHRCGISLFFLFFGSARRLRLPPDPVPFRPGFCAGCSISERNIAGCSSLPSEPPCWYQSLLLPASLPSDLRPLSVDSLVRLLSLFLSFGGRHRISSPHLVPLTDIVSQGTFVWRRPRPPAGLSSSSTYLTEADLPNPRRYFPPPHQKMIPPRFPSLHGMIANRGLCKKKKVATVLNKAPLFLNQPARGPRDASRSRGTKRYQRHTTRSHTSNRS